VPKGTEIDDLDIDIGDKNEESEKEEKEKKEEESAQKSNEAAADIFSKRGRKLDETVMVKICDLGNGCWTHHHFTPEI